MYQIDGNRITFHWLEGGIGENIIELIQGLEAAAQTSLMIRDTVRVYIPNYDTYGQIEARNMGNGISTYGPRTDTAIETMYVVSMSPYYTVRYRTSSPLYNISIPGLCQLVDHDIMAFNPEMAPYLSLIANMVFGCARSTLDFIPCPERLTAYINMPRTTALLSKRPRVPKSIDFEPILKALFGEKITTVIMKEIK